jgi:hypothetical protein
MAFGQFATFREDLLMAIARKCKEDMGSYIRPKEVADQAALKYARGWVREAVGMLEDQGFIQASFSMGSGDPDMDVSVTLRGKGWEEAERLAEQKEASLEGPPYVDIEEDSPQWLAAQDALDETLNVLKGSNEYASTEPEDRRQRIAELESGKRLLRASRVRLDALHALLISALRYLAAKFADNVIGIAAAAAIAAVGALFGIHL